MEESEQTLDPQKQVEVSEDRRRIRAALGRLSPRPATALVLTVNVALVAPAATVTLAGTRATVVLLLESVTCAPPVGAGPLNVTAPVDAFPPTTLVGFNASDDNDRDVVVLGASSNSRMAGFRSFSEMPTNFAGEIM